MFGSFVRRQRQAITDRDTEVTVYGTYWCAATQRVRRVLDRAGISYTYRDIDRDPEALSRVQWWTGGYSSHPTVQIGGDILVEPTADELQAALARNGML